MMKRFFCLIASILFNERYRLFVHNLKRASNNIGHHSTQHLSILSQFLIIGEDRRFNYHVGFDMIAIVRALKRRVINKKIEGASTIEQQLVRVLTNDRELTFQRKIREILFATTVSKTVPKEVIPAVYLSVAYYGDGMDGLDNLMKFMHLEKDKELSIETAAEIISWIKYPLPSTYNYRRVNQIYRRKRYIMGLYTKSF